MKRLPVLLAAMFVALAAGVGIALAATASTGTNTACATATATSPAHTIAVDGSNVATIKGGSGTAQQCNTVTYTIPTVTSPAQTVTSDPVTQTVTTPAQTVTSPPVTVTQTQTQTVTAPAQTTTTATQTQTTPPPTTTTGTTTTPPVVPTATNCAGTNGTVSQTALDACGLPSLDSTGPVAGTIFTNSTGFTASTAGAIYSGLNVTGGINVTASNVTIEDSTVTEVNPDTAAIQVAANVTGTQIIDDSIHGTNTVQSGALAFAVSYFGSSITGVTIDHSNFYNGDRILAGYGTVTNSYCLGGANFSSGGSLEHDECIYTDGGAPGIRVIHDTLINAQPDQTAAIFVDNNDFGGAKTDNGTVDVEDSLLAGGDYCIYGGAGNAGTVHTGPVTITGNRFSTLFFPTCGQYGHQAYTPADATWSGNVWDATNQTVPEAN